MSKQRYDSACVGRGEAFSSGRKPAPVCWATTVHPGPGSGPAGRDMRASWQMVLERAMVALLKTVAELLLGLSWVTLTLGDQFLLILYLHLVI